MNYFLHLLTLFCIYSMLSVSFDLLAGHLGIVSLLQAAFFGVGAYTSALVGGACPSYLVELGVVCIVVFFLAAVVSYIVCGNSGNMFVVITFAFQGVLSGVFMNWIALTRGAAGISGIGHPIIFGWHLQSKTAFALLALSVATLVYLVCSRVTKGPVGRAMHALRDDQLFARSMGIDPKATRQKIFVFAALIAGLSGSMYAHYLRFVDPSNFGLADSLGIAAMVILGGAGSVWGPLFGTAFMILFPELIRGFGFYEGVVANIRQIVYQLVLIILLTRRPNGVFGIYNFRGRSEATDVV